MLLWNSTKSNYLTLDDQEVWDAGDVRVDASLSSLADFFCDHDALTEQVLVNSISLLFSHKHFDRFVPFTAELPLCLKNNQLDLLKWVQNVPGVITEQFNRKIMVLSLVSWRVPWVWCARAWQLQLGSVETWFVHPMTFWFLRHVRCSWCWRIQPICPKQIGLQRWHWSKQHKNSSWGQQVFRVWIYPWQCSMGRPFCGRGLEGKEQLQLGQHREQWRPIERVSFRLVWWHGWHQQTRGLAWRLGYQRHR